MLASRLTIFLLLLSASHSAFAGNWLLFGGANRGLLAIGGLNSWGINDSSLTYGLTPSSTGGAIITQLNANTDFRVIDGESFDYRIGIGIHYNDSDKTFIDLPVYRAPFETDT